MILESVNNGFIYYNNNQVIHTKVYYDYCVNLLISWLNNSGEYVNIIFGDYDINLNNNFKVIRLDIQVEHTLVKDGGRGINERIYGTTNTDNGDLYLVRIDKFKYYNSLDYVIEYSYPNTHNIKSSGYFSEFSSKIINISPLIYEPNFDNINKVSTITLFTENSSQRRDNITKELDDKSVEYINIVNCFSYNDLVNQYSNTKIMVNVHQTDHHHTFEELRVLPALINGVIIISENVPLKEHIPYNEFIIWCEYDKLVDTIIDVQKNYVSYSDKLFNNELNSLLLTLKETNYKNLNLLNK